MPGSIKKTTIRPRMQLSLLSHKEIMALMETSQHVHKLFRQCALAVLNSGNMTDDGMALHRQYPDHPAQTR